MHKNAQAELAHIGMSEQTAVSARQRGAQIPLLGVASMVSRRAESGEPNGGYTRGGNSLVGHAL